MASACQEAKVMCETFIKFRSSQVRASLPWASTIDSNQYSWNKSIFLVFKKYWFLYWFGYWFGYWFWNRHIWSNLIQFDQIWSILIKFPLILIKFDQIWSNLIKLQFLLFVPFLLIFHKIPCWFSIEKARLEINKIYWFCLRILIRINRWCPGNWLHG